MTDPAARLPALREAALERLAGGLADLDDVIGSAGSTTGDDEHDPEGATIGFERAQAAALADAARAQLAEVDAALRRVSDGRYGVCIDCGAAIGDERLAARPAAARCIRCA